MISPFQNGKDNHKLLYFIASPQLGVVLKLVLVQPCGHLHDVVDLQLDDLGQRGEHALWDDLQHLEMKRKNYLSGAQISACV